MWINADGVPPASRRKYTAHRCKSLAYKKQDLNLITPRVLTANLQEREETKEYLKLHHGDSFSEKQIVGNCRTVTHFFPSRSHGKKWRNL